MNQKKITIFGCCVSREPFNTLLLNNEEFKIDLCLQGNLFSLFDKSLNIEEKYTCGDSNFLKRMVYYDFNKVIIPKLQQSKSDFLVVDFGEIRLSIIKLINKDFETRLSNKPQTKETIENLKKDNKLDGYTIDYSEYPYWYSIEKIRSYVQKFVDVILKTYKKENIILIVPKNCFHYETEELIFKNFEDSQRLANENQFIEDVSNIFYDILDRKIIKIIIPNDVSGDRLHKLGLSPLHYEMSCYEYLANCLYEVFTQNASQDRINKIHDEYYNKLKIEKRKIKIRTSISKEKK